MHNTQLNSSVILASSSPYRARLLQRILPEFMTLSPSIDETPHQDESPGSLCKRLAKDKALAIAQQHPNQWVIGSDQVAFCEHQLLGKPGTHKQALKQLQHCSGQTVKFMTAVCLVNIHSKVELIGDDCVEVKFRDLSEEEIVNYLKLDKPYDCAGSFKVEQTGVGLFESVKSHDPTSLEGLPLILLCKLFRQAGLKIPF